MDGYVEHLTLLFHHGQHSGRYRFGTVHRASSPCNNYPKVLQHHFLKWLLFHQGRHPEHPSDQSYYPTNNGFESPSFYHQRLYTVALRLLVWQILHAIPPVLRGHLDLLATWS